MMTPKAVRICKPDHVLVQQLHDESVLLNLNDERYFALDDVATRMWALLTSTASVQQAQEILLGEYDAEPEQIQHDLHDLVRQLVEHDLVQLVDA